MKRARKYVWGLLSLGALLFPTPRDLEAQTASPGASQKAAAVQPVRLKGHLGEVTGVVWSADSRKLYSSGRDGTLRVWAADTGLQTGELKPTNAFPEGTGLINLSISRDGSRLVALSTRGSVVLWSLPDEKVLGQWPLPPLSATRIALSPDGKRVAVGGSDGRVLLLEAGSGKEAVTLMGHTKNILSLEWRPDGGLLATGDSDGVVKLWGADGKEQQSFKPQDWFIGDLSFSPDGQRLATCSKTRLVRVHGLKDLTQPPVLEVNGETKLYAVAWTPNGRLIASGGRQDYVKVWSTTDGREVATLLDPQPDEQRGFTDIMISPDGRFLAVPHSDGLIRVWPTPASP